MKSSPSVNMYPPCNLEKRLACIAWLEGRGPSSQACCSAQEQPV
jgi:hypothetical protein